ncbi:hypothetical protein QZH41_014936, partial [Actinostola sp. cb2023]
INYLTTSKVCELNNKTKLWSPSGDFVQHEDCFYMDILERIYNPCAVEHNLARIMEHASKILIMGRSDVNATDITQGLDVRDWLPLNQIVRTVIPRSGVGNLNCAGQVLNLCQQHMTAWKALVLGPTSLDLMSCNPKEVANITELLVFVSRAGASDYGKYVVVRVKDSIGCIVTLLTPMYKTLPGSPCEIIAQRLPNFHNVSLSQSCQLTCNARAGAVGGILALRATKLTVDSTSKIDVNGKGYRGGAAGSTSGGGGYGGETFACLASTYGKGGNYNQPGREGGGAGDGSTGGPGGLNAGGGGGDSNTNSDDGAGGGGGGGHFSGGGGGGAGTGCNGQNGGTGGTASTTINSYAGGGGTCGCPAGNGGNGGSSGGNHGNNVRGGKGGLGSCSAIYGGSGGGGGFQYGNLDFHNRLSYGGGGGGGGGSAFGNAGGRGGHGGGLVLLFVDKMTLNGKIEAKGENGQCPPVKANHRGASGGSGAGGSVVIFTKELVGSVSGKIYVQGGTPPSDSVCGRGSGSGMNNT